jgi:hypothetical protein
MVDRGFRNCGNEKTVCGAECDARETNANAMSEEVFLFQFQTRFAQHE